MDFILAVVFLGALVGVLYVWPAYARPGKHMIIAFGAALAALGLLWASAYVGPYAMEEPRGMGAAIDLAFRGVATGYVIMAVVAQGVRRWAQASGFAGYRHWIVVGLGAVLPPILIVPHF